MTRKQTKSSAPSLGDYVRRIENSHVYEVAIESPLEHAPLLSERLGHEVWIKREDLQAVYSFKLRGAYNKLASLSSDERGRGVIAASAGNHAQGVALAARRHRVRAHIVMPRTTPTIKVDAVKRLGARVHLQGDSYDEASDFAHGYASEHSLSYIHPYDDPAVIAGQGTIGLEILKQAQCDIDAIFVPVGGGGLIAGILAAVKSQKPGIRIIGVEAEDSACLKLALDRGRRDSLKEVGLFADGVAVRQIGKEPFRLARHYVDDVITCTVDEICAAVRDIFEENRSLAEPAGALAVAGLKKYSKKRPRLKSRNFVVVESGANVNFDRLRHIAERSEVGEHREALIAVTIPERPGSFRKFCQDLGNRGITEFNYRLADSHAAHIFVGVQLGGEPHEKASLIARLRKRQYPVTDLSEDEMAKVHVRYMVGGRTDNIEDEILFRFEFPERPGALLKFLKGVGSRWNISLFHYRNHGAAYGRVLVGMQVPHKERRQCRESLDKLGYSYWQEDHNPAYELFLGSL